MGPNRQLMNVRAISFLLCKESHSQYHYKHGKYTDIHTRGYQKNRGLFKYLLNVNVCCNEILLAYIVQYYQQILKGTVI
jgi:hypothetical protein